MEVDHSIEVFRLKKLFTRLETAKLSGSVVPVIIPPRKVVSDVTKLLNEKTGKAAQIKDKITDKQSFRLRIRRERDLNFTRGHPTMDLFCSVVVCLMGTQLPKRKLSAILSPTNLSTCPSTTAISGSISMISRKSC